MLREQAVVLQLYYRVELSIRVAPVGAVVKAGKALLMPTLILVCAPERPVREKRKLLAYPR